MCIIKTSMSFCIVREQSDMGTIRVLVGHNVIARCLTLDITPTGHNKYYYHWHVHVYPNAETPLFLEADDTLHAQGSLFKHIIRPSSTRAPVHKHYEPHHHIVRGV
jgi:hypothetical protein